MNTAQMLDFIKPYFEKPVLEEWQPDEYYMKHVFRGTKASIRKLNATKAKEDEKLRAAYEDELSLYNEPIARIEKFGRLPAAIRDLFFHTIEWNVKTGIRVRKELEVIKDAVEEYDYGFLYMKEQDIYEYFEVRYVGNEPHWFIKEGKRDDLMYNHRGIKHIKDIDSFIGTMQDYFKAKAAARNFPCEYDSIVETSYSLVNILDNMEKLLGGTPEWCEREASWGLKGYYNGIIGRGSKRVSMKSFLAGGHNIQRLHIRCRCTPLKEAAA